MATRRRLASHVACGESMFLIQVPRRTALQWHLGSEKLHNQYGNGIQQWPSKSSMPASLSCHVWIQGCILSLLFDSQFIFQPKTRANSSLTTMLSSLTLQPLNLLWYHHCWTSWSLVSHGLLTQLILVEPTSQTLHCTTIISVDSWTLDGTSMYLVFQFLRMTVLDFPLFSFFVISHIIHPKTTSGFWI